MKNNIIDLLELLLSNIKEDGDLSENHLSKIFGPEKKPNYMEVLNREAKSLEKALPKSKDSFRLLLESEKMFFTKDAQGELIQLQSIGLISGKEVEQLIDIAIFKEFCLIDREALCNLLPSIIAENMGDPTSNIALGNNSIN
jgi:hypothetical protein